jgi:hypothetical protein
MPRQDELTQLSQDLGLYRPDIPSARLGRLRDLMNAAVRDCLVTGYEPLTEGLKLPDPDDRHVLAAAIRAGAQVIVTRNLKHFPPPNWRRGTSRRNRRTSSCSTRPASRDESSPAASGRSPTPVPPGGCSCDPSCQPSQGCLTEESVMSAHGSSLASSPA